MKSLKKVLIVDDEASLLEVYQDVLQTHYQVLTALNASEAMAICQRETPDIIVSDFDMPGISGINFCQNIRNDRRFLKIPFIILSAHSTESLRVEGFCSGVDDYISKPVSLAELKARIDAKLRWTEVISHSGGENSEELVCGNLSINHKKAEVTVADKKIDLTSFEIKLITYLIENKDKKLKRDDILMDVWSAHIVSGRTVDAHICALRQKLLDFDHKIETVRGFGYQLTKEEARKISSPKASIKMGSF